MNKLSIFTTSVLFLAMASPASASLIGTNVNVCWNTVYSGTVTTDTGVCNGSAGFTTTSATISDPGIEFSTAANTRRADFATDSITISYLSFSGSPSPDLFIFTGLPTGITGLSLLTSNPLNITTAFTSTSIALLVNAPECCATSTANVTFRIDTNASDIPEPATIVGTVLGFTAIGLSRLLRRK